MSADVVAKRSENFFFCVHGEIYYARRRPGVVFYRPYPSKIGPPRLPAPRTENSLKNSLCDFARDG